MLERYFRQMLWNHHILGAYESPIISKIEKTFVVCFWKNNTIKHLCNNRTLFSSKPSKTIEHFSLNLFHFIQKVVCAEIYREVDRVREWLLLIYQPLNNKLER